MTALYSEAGAVLEHKAFRSFDWRSAASLLRLVQQYHPDVVHFHFVNMLSADVAASALLKHSHVVFSEHSSNLKVRTRPAKQVALRMAKKALALRVDRFVAPSNYVRSRLIDEGLPASGIQTIWNGVNLDRFRAQVHAGEIRRKYGLSTTAMVVASSALLIPEKGIGDLIEAAASVAATSAEIQFIHIGDGPLLQQYKARVAELGLADRFLFAGLLNLPEIAPLIASADVFTLPCTWGEAFSLVVLEAMAAGKPVIATNLGGNPEAIEDGVSGVLVPPHDPAALARAILSLHDDPALRRRMASASAHRSDDFGVDRWVGETVELYEGLTGKLRPPDDALVSGERSELKIPEASGW